MDCIPPPKGTSVIIKLHCVNVICHTYKMICISENKRAKAADFICEISFFWEGGGFSYLPRSREFFSFLDLKGVDFLSKNATLCMVKQIK